MWLAVGLLAVARRWLAITLRHRVSHRLLTITHRLLAVAHRLLSICLWLLVLHRWHAVPTCAWILWLLVLHRWHAVSTCVRVVVWLLRAARHNCHHILLLQVSRHLVVIDLLLKFHKSIIKLRIELGALLQHALELTLGQNGIIDVREELDFGGVLVVCIYKSDEGLAVLRYRGADLLALSFKLLICFEVL